LPRFETLVYNSVSYFATIYKIGGDTSFCIYNTVEWYEKNVFRFAFIRIFLENEKKNCSENPLSIFKHDVL